MALYDAGGSQRFVHPPFCCAICQNGSSFSTREHIVPESLGNDLVVLAPGWVCDSCNNVCSSFESRALCSSILGVERCRLGVITKKQKPATAQLHGVTWFSEPSAPDNVLSAEATWSQIPVLWRADGSLGSIVVPLHDESNRDLCRLLLKMGIELLAVAHEARGCALHVTAAAQVVCGADDTPWPYFVLRRACPEGKLTSVFSSTPDAWEYVRACGFDLFLHEVDGQQVLFFQYGQFMAAVSVSSRTTNWTRMFSVWQVPYVGCPVEYAHLVG